MNDEPISPVPLTWRFGALLLLAGWTVFGVIPVASVFFVEWLEKNNFMPLALLLVAVATAAGTVFYFIGYRQGARFATELGKKAMDDLSQDHIRQLRELAEYKKNP